MEEWRQIHEHYEISNLGRARSLDRMVRNKNGVAIKKGKILSPGNQNGYMVVLLSHNGRGKMQTIHRLVAMAFIPNPKGKICVNHKDGNKQNNHVDNLEWVTYSENQFHSHRTGLHKTRRGVKNRNKILR